MSTSTSDIFRILTVAPNLIQIEVLNADQFKQDVNDFTIGSYLKISDDSNTSIIALVQSFKIKEASATGTTETTQPSFILDAQPIGFLDDVGKFKRGGQQIAIPPSNVSIADDQILKGIYESIEEDKKFCFSTLAQKPNIQIDVDGDKFFSKHIAVVGSTGSGKSGTVARILQEGILSTSEQNQKGVLNNTHILLFDLHGEYKTAFPKSKKLDVINLVLPYWLMNSEELEEMFIESNENNSHNQISQFRYAVIQNKKRHNPSVENPTYDSPLYFSLKEVHNFITNLNNEVIGKTDADNSKPKLSDGTLVDDRCDFYFDQIRTFVVSSQAVATKASNGPFNGEFDRFVMRLESKINDDRLGFLLKPKKTPTTEYETDDFPTILKQFIGYSDDAKDNITIIDLSGIPFEVLSIVVSLISRLVFDFCFYYKAIKAGTDEVPFLLVLEEAHNYIPQSEGAKYRSVKKSIERIAKEGRKYGLSLMIVSQRPSEISETIFSQCNNFVAMRLTNPTDQQYVKRLMPDSVSSITDTLPVLERQEALIIGDSIPIPTIVRIKDLIDKPDSKDILFRTEWKKDWVQITFDDLIKKLKKEV
ncbi:ATP-binding protein [Flavobacterium sp.]|uniref:ATP-binding protein n=1 Tax=Flavobacterium sp. TaxID=239 RepID=UPI003F6A4CB5